MITQSGDIAWLGVGKMGLPIAGRIAAAGFRVTAFDVNADRLAAARQLGLGVAASATEAVTGKSVVFTSLPDDKAMRDLLLSKGLLEAMAPQSILVETSTVSAEISAELGDAANGHRIDYLRLPVSGNASLANTGALTCFVSGPKAAFELVKPLLASFTRAQTYLGEAEQARYAKLAVNLMIAVSAGMMAESLALARKGGIGWQDILKVLDDSAVASPMVKYKTPPLAKRDFRIDILLPPDGQGSRSHTGSRAFGRRPASTRSASARDLCVVDRAGRRRRGLCRNRAPYGAAVGIGRSQVMA
jgi:3-hydroxyisobutyrate dehydrogenase-like beta-hydroxyacid dehydrogenase